MRDENERARIDMEKGIERKWVGTYMDKAKGMEGERQTDRLIHRQTHSDRQNDRLTGTE